MLPEPYFTTGFFPMQMALDAAYIEMVSTKSFSELPYKVSKRSFRQYRTKKPPRKHCHGRFWIIVQKKLFYLS